MTRIWSYLALAYLLTSPAAGDAVAAEAPAPGTQGASAAATTQGAAPPAVAGDEPLDYQLLSHSLFIESLRAGSHDPSGVNDYYFVVTMYALLNSAEERNLAFAKRKKIPVDLGTFGDTHIDALATWRADEKTKDVKELRVEGNAVRELAAKAMHEFNAKESDLAVMIGIVMMEKNKRFVFLGEDVEVAKTEYYPIPPTKFHSPLRKNVGLTITDDKGTLVKGEVRYSKPAA